MAFWHDREVMNANALGPRFLHGAEERLFRALLTIPDISKMRRLNHE